MVGGGGEGMVVGLNSDCGSGDGGVVMVVVVVRKEPIDMINRMIYDIDKSSA